MRSDSKQLLAPNGQPSNLNEVQWKLVRLNLFKQFFGDWINDPENSSKVVDENGEPLLCWHGGAETITEFDERYGGDTTANNEHGAFFFTNEKQVAEDYSKQAIIIRRYDGRGEDELNEYYKELSKKDIKAILENLDDYAESKVKVVCAFLNIRAPYIDDTYHGGLLDTEKLQRQIGYVKKGIDENYEFMDNDFIYDQDVVDSYKKEIEERARENNSLDEEDEIDEWQLNEAQEQVLEENGVEVELKKYDGLLIKDCVDDIGEGSKIAQDEYIVLKPNQIKSASGKNKSFNIYHNDIRYVEGGGINILKPRVSNEEISKKHGISIAEVEKQIQAGIKVEREHTKDDKVAETIASHHLEELPDYYDRLEKMEHEEESKAGLLFYSPQVIMHKDDPNNIKYYNGLFKSLGIDMVLKKYLGKGMSGMAFLTTKGTVCKTTNNEREAFVSLKMKYRQDELKAQIKIRNVYKIVSDTNELFVVEKDKALVLDKYLKDNLGIGFYEQPYKYLLHKISNWVKADVTNEEMYSRLNEHDDYRRVTEDLEHKKRVDKFFSDFADFCRRLKFDREHLNESISDVNDENIGYVGNKIYCFDCGNESSGKLMNGGGLDVEKFDGGGFFNDPYLQTKIQANEIITGNKSFKRLSQAEESGRIKSGSRNVEATLLCQRSKGAGDEAEQSILQQQELEKFSKAENIWFDYSEKPFEESLGEYYDRGSEAKLYYGGVDEFVIKAIELYYSASPLDFLDRISLHNYLFPQTYCEVIGFGKNEDELFVVIIKQPYIKSKTKATIEEIKTELEKLGYTHSRRNDYYNADYLLEDMSCDNVLIDIFGNYQFVDTRLSLNTKDLGLGGMREIEEEKFVDGGSIEKITLVRGVGKNIGSAVDLYGSGIYLSDSEDVARFYGDELHYYKVSGKVFDTSIDFSPSFLRKITNAIDNITESGAGAKYLKDVIDYNDGKLPTKTDCDYTTLLNALSSNFELYSELKNKGLLINEFNPDANFATLINKALANLGYVGLKYSTDKIDDLSENNLGGKTAYLIFNGDSISETVERKLSNGGSVGEVEELKSKLKELGDYFFNKGKGLGNRSIDEWEEKGREQANIYVRLKELTGDSIGRTPEEIKEQKEREKRGEVDIPEWIGEYKMKIGKMLEGEDKKSKHRVHVPNVRGGWTKAKILKHLKSRTGSHVSHGKISISRIIAEFDSPQELKEHIYYHGSGGGVSSSLKPSITIPEREMETYGGGGYGDRYWAISLSKNKNIASNFMGQSRYGSVYPVILKKGSNVISMPEMSDSNEIEDIIEFLWENKVDAIKIGYWEDRHSEQELSVINPDCIYKYDVSDSFSVFGKMPFENLTDEQIADIYYTAKLNVQELDKIKKMFPVDFNKSREERLAIRDEKDRLMNELPKFKFEDGGVIRVDEFGKQIVWESGDYFIAVDNAKDARLVTLWNKNIKGRIGAIYTTLKEFQDWYGKDKAGKWLSIDSIGIDKKHQGMGFSKQMYRILLHFSAPDVKGIYSYLPQRSNMKQVPRIYKKFVSEIVDGDHQFILKEKNIGRFEDGGSILNSDTDLLGSKKTDWMKGSFALNMEFLGKGEESGSVIIKKDDGYYLGKGRGEEVKIKNQKRAEVAFDNAQKIALEVSLENGDVAKAISEGRISLADAKSIIESSGLDVPKYILNEQALENFEIKENGNCENYQRAIKFAKENGYLLSKDISYNGYVFFEKIIDDGYYKLELQIYDDIIKKHSPKYLQYEKTANFGQSIMSEATYSYRMSGNQSDWNSETLDELFSLALRKEKELSQENKKPMETEIIESQKPKTFEEEILEMPTPEKSDLSDFQERITADNLIEVGISKNIAEKIAVKLFIKGNGISYLFGKSKEELEKEFEGMASGDLDKLFAYTEKRKGSEYHVFPNAVTIRTAYDIPELVKNELINLNVPVKKFPLPFNLDDRDALLDLTKEIIGEDDLRPQMEKVWGMEDSIVFTDAHKLLFVPIAKKIRGAIDPKVQLAKGIYRTDFDKSKFVEGKKGLYQKKAETKGESWHIDSKTDLERHSFMSVVPDYGEKEYQGKITCAVLYRYMYFIERYFTGEDTNKKCSMKYKFGDNEVIAVNPEFTMAIMKKFLNLGIETVHVYASAPSRPIIFCEQKLGKMNNFANKYKTITKATFCELMPVMLSDVEAPMTSGGVGSVTNLDRSIQNCLAFDIRNDRVIDIDGLPCYIANSESLLSVSDFDISQKDFKRNRTELKKKYNDYAVDSWLKEAFEVFKERFKGKVYAELNYHERKIILSLQWLYLYHPTWRY